MCGNAFRDNIDKLYFFDCLGTLDFADNLVYEYARSAYKLLFIKMKKEVGLLNLKDMFVRPIFMHYATYKGLEIPKTASEVGDSFLVATVEKGQRKALDVLTEQGIQVRCLPDPDDVNRLFACCKLYARDEDVAKEIVSRLERKARRGRGYSGYFYL